MTLYCLTVLCLWTRFIASHARNVAYVGPTLPIKHPVDSSVHPFDEWPVVSIVGREDRLKFVSSFQLVSGTAYCDRLSGERYSEATGQQLSVLSWE